MVIINYKGGQLGNRMMLYAHFMANCLEYGYTLYNPEFNEYIRYFEKTQLTQNKKIITTRLGNRRIDRTMSLLIRGWTNITYRLNQRNPIYRLYRIFKTHDRKQRVFDLNDSRFIEDARHKNTIVQGWLFRDYRHIEKYHGEICAHFKPLKKYRSEVELVLQRAREAGNLLIGVHIRRGDYARYENGKYFFTDEVYAEKIVQLDKRYSLNRKKCVFVLCSNDEVNLALFPKNLAILFEKRHFITDMYLLAACDAIMGPPSTFSIWASYHGRVPLIQLEHRDQLMEIGPYVSRC